MRCLDPVYVSICPFLITIWTAFPLFQITDARDIPTVFWFLSGPMSRTLSMTIRAPRAAWATRSRDQSLLLRIDHIGEIEACQIFPAIGSEQPHACRIYIFDPSLLVYYDPVGRTFSEIAVPLFA